MTSPGMKALSLSPSLLLSLTHTPPLSHTHCRYLSPSLSVSLWYLCLRSCSSLLVSEARMSTCNFSWDVQSSYFVACVYGQNFFSFMSPIILRASRSLYFELNSPLLSSFFQVFLKQTPLMKQCADICRKPTTK